MSENFDFSTTAEDVADVFANEIRGRNVLITGTSIGGIGFETAQAIAKYANSVIITGYNAERLQLSADAIQKDFPVVNVRQLMLDLSSLASVRKAAAEVIAYLCTSDRLIKVLINNAVAAVEPFKITEDNLEMQMAAGHIGPFLFTNLLAPKLIASCGAAGFPTNPLARVVFVASDGHLLKAVDFSTPLGDPTNPARHESAFGFYQEMKSASILATIEMARRAKGKMEVFSLHPGCKPYHLGTGMYNDCHSLGLFDENEQPSPKFDWKTIPQGAATHVLSAFSSRIFHLNQSGSYLVDCKVANDQRAPHASDPTNAARVWEATERVLGQKFEV
ncbi:NAD-P-binding protein [Roridomyces roridus]|uniref:NAD-P-binding protein n=1 Tax=Roridomyces roridus TaxID=1738132 RepID=A0AAD7BBH8_9AGAR|nr:NAD-P-binding protein [Roridomyces roridus]